MCAEMMYINILSALFRYCFSTLSIDVALDEVI